MNGPVGERMSRLPGCFVIWSQGLSHLPFLAMNLHPHAAADRIGAK